MKPSTARVLERLRFGHASTHDLCQPNIGGVRFGARLQELRDLGYVISREYVRDGSHVYRLLAEPSHDRGSAHAPTVTSGAPLAARGEMGPEQPPREAEPLPTSPAALSPAGKPPAPIPQPARATTSKPAGVTGSTQRQGQKDRGWSVTASIPERNEVVETLHPRSVPQCALFDWDEAA